MANTSFLQLLHDGPRNVAIKIVGFIDTAGDIGISTLLDPATLTPTCESLAIQKIDFSFPPNSNLSIQFFWEATTNVLIYSVSNGDDQCFEDIGGISPPLPRPSGFTGKILYKTVGGVELFATSTYAFSAVVLCKKKNAVRRVRNGNCN